MLRNFAAGEVARSALDCGSGSYRFSILDLTCVPREKAVAAATAVQSLRHTPTLLRLGLSLVLVALLSAWSPLARADNSDSEPAQLSKARSDLYLKATRVPVADFADDINQLAVRSETCRAQHGSKACGLPEKALSSDQLEDRFAYYVKQPVESHAKAKSAKIARRNWVGTEPAEPDSNQPEK